ncbi:MAG: MerR family transcriptional regulator [Cyanobacteriota bacterium]
MKTIRFYCDQGLIHPVRRSDGGFRLFDHSIYSELSLIGSLKIMEVPLSEIRQVLEVRRTGICNCVALKTAIRIRIEAMSRRLLELEGIRDELHQLLEGWQECGGKKVEPDY